MPETETDRDILMGATLGFNECPECGEQLAKTQHFDGIGTAIIYRRHRRVHYTWGPDIDPEDDEYLECHYDDPLEDDQENEDGEDEDEFATEEFTVTFHSEMVERITVEAYDKHEAKRKAKDQRDYDGEITHTMHTEVDQ